MNNTVTTMARYVGQQGVFETKEGLAVHVRILDARIDFGQLRVKIVPLAGTGECWVNAGRVLLPTKPKEG